MIIIISDVLNFSSESALAKNIILQANIELGRRFRLKTLIYFLYCNSFIGMTQIIIRNFSTIQIVCWDYYVILIQFSRGPEIKLVFTSIYILICGGILKLFLIACLTCYDNWTSAVHKLHCLLAFEYDCLFSIIEYIISNFLSCFCNSITHFES